MSEQEQRRRRLVLLVDDSRTDQDLTRLAFEHAGVGAELVVATDGEEAMDYLARSAGGQDDAELPDLILLDLNLPRLDGHELLREVRADPEFHSLPVIVFTTSAAPEDVRKSYDLGCNSFITKPIAFDDFVDFASTLEHYWLDLVTVPSLPPA